jgi:hypothetical protein
VFQSETAPVKGPLGLIPIASIPIAVTALFDDYGPVAAVSVPAAVPVPAAMEAAIVLTELGSRAAEVITITEPDPITVAADADADPELFGAGYGRRRNGNSRQGCKRKTKFSHVPSSLVAAQEKTVEPNACSWREAVSQASMLHIIDFSPQHTSRRSR